MSGSSDRTIDIASSVASRCSSGALLTDRAEGERSNERSAGHGRGRGLVGPERERERSAERIAQSPVPPDKDRRDDPQTSRPAGNAAGDKTPLNRLAVLG